MHDVRERKHGTYRDLCFHVSQSSDFQKEMAEDRVHREAQEVRRFPGVEMSAIFLHNEDYKCSGVTRDDNAELYM